MQKNTANKHVPGLVAVENTCVPVCVLESACVRTHNMCAVHTYNSREIICNRYHLWKSARNAQKCREINKAKNNGARGVCVKIRNAVQYFTFAV